MNYNFKDLTGQRFGKLTVIERAEDAVFASGKLVQWKCKCDCGNEKIVIGCNLKKTKSCGCEMHNGANLQDLVGHRFGSLTVLERAENKKLPSGQNQTAWKCKYDCGGLLIARGTHLKDGLTTSCGCYKSKYEKRIAQILSQNNIKFYKQYSFDDCRDKEGFILLYDFGIVTDDDKLICLIEYQGEQHYIDSIMFGVKQRKETDQTKKEYCIKNNISLYEITYKQDLEKETLKIISMLHDNTVP